MPHYNGRLGNSQFGKHTTAIEGTEDLIIALSKMPYKNRIKLGIITSRKPAFPFLNCTVTDTSLIFKIGTSSVQSITVTINGSTPKAFLELLQTRYTADIRVR
jgi:hypothetical protein